MDGHFVGQGQFSEESGSTSASSGASLAVKQWMAFVWGTVQPHAESQPWRVHALVADERYCKRCLAVHTFDVIVGLQRELAICRCCEKEDTHV